jgi:hypothetical protein
MRQNITITLTVAAFLLILSGCSQKTLNSARQDAEHNIDTAKPSLAKLTLGGRVTAALAAAKIQGVRVDADTNGVSLHGTVRSAAEKARAGRIARETLSPEKHVINQIEVLSP